MDPVFSIPEKWHFVITESCLSTNLQIIRGGIVIVKNAATHDNIRRNDLNLLREMFGRRQFQLGKGIDTLVGFERLHWNSLWP